MEIENWFLIHHVIWPLLQKAEIALLSIKSFKLRAISGFGSNDTVTQRHIILSMINI